MRMPSDSIYPFACGLYFAQCMYESLRWRLRERYSKLSGRPSLSPESFYSLKVIWSGVYFFLQPSNHSPDISCQSAMDTEIKVLSPSQRLRVFEVCSRTI